jgi:hypothetical protein
VSAWQSKLAVSHAKHYSVDLHFAFSGQYTAAQSPDKSLSGVVSLIDKALPSEWRAAITPGQPGLGGVWLTIEPTEPFDPIPTLVVSGNLKDNDTPVELQEIKYYGSAFPQVADKETMMGTTDGAVINLGQQAWTLHPWDKPVLVLTSENKDQVDKGKHTCDDTKRTLDPYSPACTQQYLLARNDQNEIAVVMEVTDKGLKISRDALNGELRYAVNGALPFDPDSGPFLVRISNGDLWHIDWFKAPLGCRAYNTNAKEYGNVEINEPNEPNGSEASLPGAKSNHIVVGNAKVFDTGLLQQMLNGTAAQLAAISGFSSASITGAFGNFQGVVRDTSYLSAQVTTTPLPTIATTNTNGLTGTGQTVIGSANPSQTATTVTLQCPNGSLPTLGSGSTEGCAVPTPPAGVSITVPSTSTGTITTNGITTPGTTTQQTTGNQTNQQNSTTSTTNGVAGTVPTAPTATPFSAPTNVGVSSADILTEQVELNAQITNLRLLLQGALSDQYVIRHSRPVANRKQTTLGFTITLDPPRQFRHAVAEVRVLIVPPPGPDGASIVNLLPAEKTYNVAKITSHQDAFGAGVAVAPVSVGVAAGRSKDRLYLVKDTDTLALQYAPPVETLTSMKRPIPQYAHDKYKGLADMMGWDELGNCNDPGERNEPDQKGLKIGTNATIFGWQFRPVLGEQYVRGGQRQVFAQLAMPPGTTTQTPPFKMYIQTRWRAYDPKRQVVGAVYTSSCSSAADLSGIADIPVISVKDVQMTDLGAGQLKLTSTGTFDTPSLSVLAGTTNIVPLASDGQTLQLFGNAHDLLAADKLMILGPSGSTATFGRRAKQSEGCGFSGVALDAVPYPDGNSRMTLKVTMGEKYLSENEADGLPMPLVLIGNQVYGLRETPFRECVGKDCRCTRVPVKEDPAEKDDGATKGSLVCTYKFVAPTTDVRNAQSFLVKDLRWESMSSKGTTNFFPAFSSLTAATSPPAASCPGATPPSSDKKKTGSDCPKSSDSTGDRATTLMVSGFDFDKLVKATAADCKPSPRKPCLKVFVGDKELAGDNQQGFMPVTRNLATLAETQASPNTAKIVRFQLNGEKDQVGEYSVEWDLTLPKSDKTPDVTANPAILRVSDSLAVVFTGDKIATADPNSVKFDGNVSLNATLDAKAKTLTVYVTTAVTKTPGHKVLTVNVPKTPADNTTNQTVQLPLPFDVYK